MLSSNMFVCGVQIDPQLERMMHPHQVVAANFLLHRLNGPLPHAVANHNNDFSFHSSVKDIMSSTPVNPSVSSITTATTAIDHDLDYIFNSDDDSDNSSDNSYETAGGNDGGQWLLDSETVQRLENKQVQQLKERKKQSSQPRVLSNQKATPSVSQPEFKNCLGAVLADEMGLGKSLVSIAVLWHFVNHGAL
jgi:SNF2 family DNA or RNA helicase